MAASVKGTGPSMVFLQESPVTLINHAVSARDTPNATMTPDTFYDKSRGLKVVVPLNREHATDVTFRGVLRFLDEKQTCAALFPPVNKDGEFSIVTSNELPKPCSIERVTDKSLFPLAKARKRYEVRSLSTDKVLMNAGVIIRDAKKSRTLVETVGEAAGQTYTFSWPTSKDMIFVSVDKEVNLSLSDEAYLFMTSDKQFQVLSPVISYSIPQGLFASLYYTIILDMTNTGPVNCVISRGFIVTNPTDIDFDRINQLLIVDSTGGQITNESFLPSPSRIYASSSASPAYAVASRSTENDEVIAAPSENESDSYLRSLKKRHVPIHYAYNRTLNIGRLSQMQLTDETSTNSLVFLVNHIDNLRSSDSNASISRALWFPTDAVEGAIIRSAPAKLSLLGLTEEPLSFTFTWDRDEDPMEVGFIPKQLKNTPAELLNIGYLSTTYSKHTPVVDTIFSVVNNYAQAMTIAIATYPGQQDGRCLGISKFTPAQTPRRAPWEASANPRQYTIFSVAGKSSLTFSAQFSTVPGRG